LTWDQQDFIEAKATGIFMEETTREPQYQSLVTLKNRSGLTSFGLMSNGVWQEDPRRIGFVLARYKFVAKMFSGLSRVLEVGCADAFGTRIVQQEVGELVAIDFDPVFVQDVNSRMEERWMFTCKVHDMISGPIDEQFDGAYSIDVLEHINSEEEHHFIGNMVKSLSPTGACIIGSPSLESQNYASAASKEGHVNCKSAPELKALMLNYFHNVFIFSMNDEIVHTGFHKLAHYLFAVCAGRRELA
jgi:2-polyprenyl-3-methyl-5-hydroxy-6-metoxy-1,4-benzoquinol methylase